MAYKAHLASLPQADIIPTADPTGDVASASSMGIIPIPDIRTPSTDINTVLRIPTDTTASITAHTTKNDPPDNQSSTSAIPWHSAWDTSINIHCKPQGAFLDVVSR